MLAVPSFNARAPEIRRAVQQIHDRDADIAHQAF